HRSVDGPFLLSLLVREMGYSPMHRRAGCDAYKDTPHHKRPSAQPIQNESDRNLLQHPGAIEEPIEGIVANSRAGIETWRALQNQAAMEIEQAIQPAACPAREDCINIGRAL